MAKMAKSSFMTSSLFHNTQLLAAIIWMPVWDTPTFWCFPFRICVSIPVSVLWERCTVQTEKKSGEEKLVWQVFSCFMTQTPFCLLQHNVIDLISSPMEQRAFGSHCSRLLANRSLL